MTDLSKVQDLVEVIVASSFPSQNEIVLRNEGIAIDVQDSPSGQTIDSKYRHSNKKHERQKSFKENSSNYAEIGVQLDHCNQEKSETISPKPPKSPTSIYTVGGNLNKPKLELKDMGVSTRQCKFEIGEEVERFQSNQADKPSSPPSSPTQERLKQTLGSHVNAEFAPSGPGADRPTVGGPEKTADTFPFHILFTTTSPTTVLKPHQIMPNPYNKLNHRFHSTLQCPCFLFFFFLCCLPAIHMMQKSDSMFRKGNNHQAKRFGKFSMVFFAIGTIIGVAFLSVSIYFAADYVRQFV